MDMTNQLSSALALAESSGAEPELSAKQLDELRQAGSERTVAAGEVLFRPGDIYDFVAIVDGRIAVIEDIGGRHERVVAERGPGGFIGEVGMLSRQPFPFTCVAREVSHVIEVPVDALRRIIDEAPALSELILHAFLMRRALLIGQGLGLKVVGSRYSADARRLLEFLTGNGLPFGWLDVERDPAAEALLRDFNVRPEEIPVVIAGSIVMRNPSNEELAKTLGFVPTLQSTDVFDLLVVGAGPAGLAASVYAASEGLSTLAIDAVAVGGQAGTSSRIENYLGFPAGVSGRELAVRAQLQAEKFDARITVPCQAIALEQVDGLHRVRLSSGDTILARAVIIASGAQYARLSLDRLTELEGMGGVYYAATVAEARMCAGDSVALVGGGNSAGQAAVFLARRCKRVYVLVRRAGLAETMSRYLIHQIEGHDNIEVLPRTEVRKLLGDERITGVEIESGVDGSRRRLDVRALFVFIGAEPHTSWLSGQIALDEHGFVLTGKDLPADNGRTRLPLETSRPGVFAAGDVRSGSIKRVASAVGEGSMAVRLVHDYFESTAPVILSG
jgi:thioredoxin reductase (NADPH)